MKEQDYMSIISVNATAQEAFKCVNSVSKWWTENLEGSSQKLNDEFTVRFGDMHYSKQKLVEVIPGKKVIWLVMESKLSWLSDKHEWTNTKICFEISTRNNKTQITFTHIGLVPGAECYTDCVKGWTQYLKSLFRLVTEGKGQPDLKN